MGRRRQFFLLLFALCLPVWALSIEGSAFATPEAHILRIDPRTGLKDNRPILTSVIEVVELERVSDVLAPCANVSGAATLSCWSEQLEKPGALWKPYPFPEANARLLVKVSGEDQLTKFADKTQWGKAQNQPNVGTAWLVAIDSSSSMGSRFGDARAIAHEFIEEMQPNDLMDLMFFDDVQVVRDTHWKTFKQRADLGNALNEFKSTSASHGRDRPLFSEIKAMTRDGFGSLGNSDQPDTVPLHQAMVVLSNGAGRGDPESASPSADLFHQYLDKGRFPEDNTSLPKTPLPVISIWLPNGSSMMESIYRNNEAQFMQALANPEIGGFFDIVQEGQGDKKAGPIIKLVRARFNAMWLIHWTMSCINPSVEQTFNLVFENTHPAIAPDGTFKEVPIGMDPTQWPLDVDVAKTTKAAQDNPLYPGGQFTVYGDFCWSGDKQRAEAYFIPAGTRPNTQTTSRDPELAKKAMQQLQAEHMLGIAAAAGDGYATFVVPDDDKVLEGTGENTVARLVVYDNKAHRASSVDEKTVLTLKATKKPWSLPLVAGIGGLVVVIVLLTMVLLRGGRRRGGGGGGGAPAHQDYAYRGPAAGYGGGPPPYGGAPPAPAYGVPPPGAYGASPAPGPYGAADPLAATAQVPIGAPPPAVTPQGIYAVPPASPLAAPRDAGVAQGGPSGATGQQGTPIVQVRCPSCGMTTMATPGQPSVCFSCGQPLPAELTKAAGGPPPNPAYTPAGGYGAPLPYGASAAPPSHPASAATIRGTAGQFTIRPGSEVRVGRDPSQCPIFLSEPRVSGVHATLKFEGGQLLVRDETSNNGTWIAGSRIPPGMWTAVAPGAQLRFGPIEFTVQHEP
jgi:hypothetical protein